MFILLISRNDAAAHLYEIMEYQHTVELVKDFVRNNPDTVLISTSDHETGGLTVGRQVGSAYPEYKWQVVPLILAWRP
jgi:alkaline phosphatase